MHRTLGIAVAVMAPAFIAPVSFPAAWGQSTSVSAHQRKVDRFRSQDQFSVAIILRSVQGMKAVAGTCRIPKSAIREAVLNPRFIGSYDRIRLAGRPLRPVSGVWIERTTFRLCGRIVHINLLVRATRRGIGIGLLPPGESLTPPLVQLEILRSFRARYRRVVRRCPTARIIDVSPVRRTLRPSRWSEVWTSRECGRLRKITVQLSRTNGSDDVRFRIK